MQELNYFLLPAVAFLVGAGVAYALVRVRGNKTESELRASLAEKEGELSAVRIENAALNERIKLAGQQYEERISELKQAREVLAKEFENLANRIFDAKQENFSRQSKQALDMTLDPVRRELKDFRKKVEDVYEKESAERNKLVGQIGELQKQAHQISTDAANLASALKGDSKTQGNWGEVVLERILEESGLRKGREYETQLSFTDDEGKRRLPDVIVRLPDNRDIVVDAKVSLTDYERYCGESDADKKTQYLNQHLLSIRSHIKWLGKKSYEKLEGINTLDFVLIFVPVEAAFMLALEHDHTLFRDAYDQGIIMVSPSTLLATLRTIHNIWRYEDQNRNAERIADQAGKLYDQFVLLIESMDEIGKHLDRTQLSWETAQKRLHGGRGNLVKRVEDLRQLGARTRKNIPDKSLERAQDEEEALSLPTVNEQNDSE